MNDREQWYNRPIGIPFHRPSTSANANYQLTTLGQKKAENFNMIGNKAEVVMALETNAPCTINEISNITKMSPFNVKQIMNHLLRDGWARQISGDEG